MTAHARHSAGVLDRMKAHWHEFVRAKPGDRFQARYRRRRRQGHNPLLKALYLGVGSVLLLAGIVLMPAPGPGIIVAAFGAALIAEESCAAAHVLDWLELRARRLASRAQRMWKRASGVQRALVVVAAAFVTITAALAAFAIIMD